MKGVQRCWMDLCISCIDRENAEMLGKAVSEVLASNDKYKETMGTNPSYAYAVTFEITPEAEDGIMKYHLDLFVDAEAEVELIPYDEYGEGGYIEDMKELKDFTKDVAEVLRKTNKGNIDIGDYNTLAGFFLNFSENCLVDYSIDSEEDVCDRVSYENENGYNPDEEYNADYEEYLYECRQNRDDDYYDVQHYLHDM